MKRIYLLVLCAMLLLLLASCACQHEWKDATCDSPKTCTLCGETEGEALSHQWQDATCTAPKTCTLCNKTEGEALGHTFDDGAPDCENPKACGVCGHLDGEAKPHTWVEADCANPKTCSVCAKTEGTPNDHQWQDATCTTPKTCSACGVTEGEPIAHTWVDANCTTARSCTACGATEGAPLGHSWLAATCETAKTCEICGVTDGEAKGHDWKEATSDKPKTCRVCGETDGSKLDVDPRFKTKACKFLFGEWKEQITESVELDGMVYTLEYWYYYEFQKDGTVLVTMVVDNEEEFLATYEDMMVAIMYATYAEMGYNKSQAEADFRSNYNMSIRQYCKLYAEEFLSNMVGTAQEMVYYVEDNVLFIAENWKSEFYGEEFEVIDGEVHITYSDGSGEYVLIPVD